MLAQTLRLALRRLSRRPGTTAVHIGGLSIGLACCFLALLFVRDELAYDRFHEGAEQIVDITQRVQMGDRTMNFQTMPEGGLDALRTGASGVIAVAPTSDASGLVRSARGAEGVTVETVRFADSGFFDVFTFPLARGDEQSALEGADKTVLTVSLARTLFGDTDPIGRDVFVERTGFGLQDPEPLALTVTGIAEDPPEASSVTFDLLVSGATRLAGYEGETYAALSEISSTYVRLASISDTAAVKAALDPLVLAEDGPFAEFGERFGVFTPQLVSRHLDVDYPRATLVGRRMYLVLFSTVAALILLLACVNYANLATALALSRSTEVGVRKTLGAGRGQLVRQFMAEAVLLALASGAVAIVLTALALPTFNGFFEKGVSLASLPPEAWAVPLALALFAGLLAGAYPALVLARFRPIAALRGTLTQGAGGTRVRQGLVVFQFAVTAMLLAGTAIVAQQLDTSRSLDLGFEGDRVITFDLGADRLRQRSATLKSEMESLPGVAHVSLTTSAPGQSGNMIRVSRWDTNADQSDDINADYLQTDADYPATMGMTLAAGRWVTSEDRFGENVVINETAARTFGLMTTNPQEAIGGELGTGRGETPTVVVGVVRDVHLKGPREEIAPLYVQPMTEYVNTLLLSVQLASGDARALDALRTAWQKAVPEYPFDPRFVSDAFAGQLREDKQLGQLFAAFGFIAILLACMGVFGLAAHEAERRTKEIGIRKVLGASVSGIVARLSGEFARLVVVALVLAVPVTIVLAQRWLEDFAYPAPLAAAPFVLVALGVLLLALLASGVHAVRAARADPIHALRSE